MNRTTTDAMEVVFSICLLLATLAYTVWSMTEWPDHFKLVPSAATVYIEHIEIPKDVPWRGTQVVAKLYQLSEDDDIVPIIIDGFTFQTEEDVFLNQNRVSLSADYRQEVIINEDGHVSQIIFTKKGV